MTPRQVVGMWVERFNAGNASAIAELYHLDAVNHQVTQNPVKGRHAIENMFAKEFAAAKMICIPVKIHEAWFDAFLDRLRTLGNVCLVKVSAPASQCLERVRTRDRAQHLAVSDARVAEINAVAEDLDLPWSMAVDNRTEADASQCIQHLKAHLSGQAVTERPG